MRIPAFVKGIQVKYEKAKRDLDKMAGNPVLVGKISNNEDEQEVTRKEIARIRAKIAGLDEQMVNECPAIGTEAGLVRHVAAKFPELIEGETFPMQFAEITDGMKPDVVLRLLVENQKKAGALLAAFQDMYLRPYRKKWLRSQRDIKCGELGVAERRLAELQKDLTALEYELSQ